MRTFEIGATGPPGAHARLHPAGGHAVHAVDLGQGVEQLPVALAARSACGGSCVATLSRRSATCRPRVQACRPRPPGSGSPRPHRASSALVPPLSTSAASRPAAAAAATSVSSRSPTTSVAPSPSRSSAVRKSCGSGLPTIWARRAGGGLDRRHDRARAGPQARPASGRWGRGSWPGARRPAGRPARRRAGRRRPARRCRRPPRARRARRGRSRSAPAAPASATWPRRALGADHERGPAARGSRPAGAARRRRRSRRRPSDAWTPIFHSLATYSSPDAARVVGGEGEPLARLAQLRRRPRPSPARAPRRPRCSRRGRG